MLINRTLFRYRLKANVTQHELAEYIGFAHRSSIQRLEAGNVQWKFKDVVKTCELLGLEIEIKEKQNNE